VIGLAKLFIKLTLAFAISFVVLSIPIGNQTIFETLSNHIKPFDKNFVSKTKKAVKISLETTRSIGKQFISNTTPNVYKEKKVIHVQRNALSNDIKKEQGKSKFDKPEKYKDTDKRSLDTLFN
jgi:hypothetical protein